MPAGRAEEGGRGEDEGGGGVAGRWKPERGLKSEKEQDRFESSCPFLVPSYSRISRIEALHSLARALDVLLKYNSLLKPCAITQCLCNISLGKYRILQLNSWVDRPSRK